MRRLLPSIVEQENSPLSSKHKVTAETHEFQRSLYVLRIRGYFPALLWKGGAVAPNNNPKLVIIQTLVLDEVGQRRQVVACEQVRRSV